MIAALLALGLMGFLVAQSALSTPPPAPEPTRTEAPAPVPSAP